MHIGIFASAADPVADHIGEMAKARGHAVTSFALGRIEAGAPLQLGEGRWLYEGAAVDACDAFVLRQVPSQQAVPSDPNLTLSADDWFRLSVHQHERAALAQSCVVDLELGGKPVVNPWLASSFFDHKPLQLAALRRAGVPLPRTLVTNDPESARAFAAGLSEAIVKPVWGGAETRLFTPELAQRLDAIRLAPVIVQERVRGSDIRATVVGRKVVGAVHIVGDALDYRGSAEYRRGAQRYVPLSLPDEVQRLCVVAAQACGQVLSGIDLKERADGGYVFLEANSSPVYLDIERKAGVPITAALLDYLEAAEPRAAR